MILSIYLTLLFIAISMIVLGYWKEKPVVQIFGFSVLILLGAVLMNVQTPILTTGGIQYKTGTTIDASSMANIIATDTYDTYSNLTYGFLLTMTGLFLIGIVIFDPRVKF